MNEPNTATAEKAAAPKTTIEKLAGTPPEQDKTPANQAAIEAGQEALKRKPTAADIIREQDEKRTPEERARLDALVAEKKKGRARAAAPEKSRRTLAQATSAIEEELSEISKRRQIIKERMTELVVESRAAESTAASLTKLLEKFS